MKFSAAGIAVSIATVTALAPSISFVRRDTALEGHILSGYDPSDKQAVSDVGPSGISGFSGFSHGVAGSPTVASVPVAPVPCVAPSTGDVISFSGFSHVSAQMGGSNPSQIGQTFVSPAPAAPPTTEPQDLVFSSFLGRLVAVRKASPAPVFSGFGHFKGQMGGNPPLVGKASTTPKSSPAAGFSGFGHSPGHMRGNPSIITKR